MATAGRDAHVVAAAWLATGSVALLAPVVDALVDTGSSLVAAPLERGRPVQIRKWTARAEYRIARSLLTLRTTTWSDADARSVGVVADFAIVETGPGPTLRRWSAGVTCLMLSTPQRDCKVVADVGRRLQHFHGCRRLSGCH